MLRHNELLQTPNPLPSIRRVCIAKSFRATFQVWIITQYLRITYPGVVFRTMVSEKASRFGVMRVKQTIQETKNKLTFCRANTEHSSLFIEESNIPILDIDISRISPSKNV